MKTAIRILLGLPVPRGEFEGTAGEKAVYEYAVRQWRAAAYKIRAERFLSRTFGANVRRAAMLVAFAAIATGCGGSSPTEPAVVAPTPAPVYSYGIVTGHVLDASGRELVGAVLWWDYNHSSLAVTSSGFSFPITPGVQTIEVSAPGYQLNLFTINVQAYPATNPPVTVRMQMARP